jgi:hypothetical protein
LPNTTMNVILHSKSEQITQLTRMSEERDSLPV